MIRFLTIGTLLFNSVAFVAIKNERTENNVTFSIRNAGMEVTGSLAGVKTEIRFNPDDLPHSSIVASAEAATLTTGITIRDNHLKKPDYFDVARYPLIHLHSKQFQKKGRNAFEGTFDLTIRNTTKEVTIPFLLIKKDHRTYLVGKFEFNRLDFNLGERSSVLEDRVVVSLRSQL